MNMPTFAAPSATKEKPESAIQQGAQAPQGGFDTFAQSLPAPSGITAQGVNAAAATQYPTSKFEFLARGGISNTANQVIKEIGYKRFKNALNKEYMALLAKGRAGADEIYQSAIKKYGEDAKDYIPPPDVMNDVETGKFDAQKYSTMVFTGIQKLKENQMAQDKANREAQAAQDKANREAQIPTFTITGQQELQEISNTFPGKTKQEFKQYAMQSDGFKSGRITMDAIDKASEQFNSSTDLAQLRYWLSEKRQEFAEEKADIAKLEKLQTDMERKREEFRIAQLDKEAELKIAKSNIGESGMPQVPDSTKIAELEKEVSRLKQGYQESDNAVRETHVKMAAITHGPGTKVKFDSIGNPTIVGQETPYSSDSGSYAPSQPGQAGGESAPPATNDPYTAKAIELLKGKGVESPSREAIAKVVERLKSFTSAQ